MASILWQLHGIRIQFESNSSTIKNYWQQTLAPFPSGRGRTTLKIRLDTTASVPEPPDKMPDFRQGDLLAYYIEGSVVIAHFPRFGQLELDLSSGSTRGKLRTDAVENLNILEDMVAIGLSPHLRRRGMFLIHAFAAACEGRGVILIGPIAAGKTTTGMALLDAGWQLLSNDSPIISQDGRILSYPGMLTAYPETFARFEEATRSLNLPVKTPQRKKIAVAAENIWPSVWEDQAVAAAIFFLKIETREKPFVIPLSPADSLRQILPHAIEQWDQAMIPPHLQVLSRLVERASSFSLHLGRNIKAVAPLLQEIVNTVDHS